ncbi:DUF6691 family protein [Hirschia litorea]|uniref:DUF6691 family protein n=1 Tax=Hirschia litorea TaxID=1199156 RepID=A0ABW2INN6_9PROT
MSKHISGLFAGLIFGLGLTISQMTNPEKVISFLDIFGEWDPSLAFVMGGAVITSFIGYRLVWRRKTPLFDTQFQIPKNTSIDPKLAIGATLFGIGWGLVGLCPGPAIAGLLIGGKNILIFLAAMIAGMVVFEIYNRSAIR